MDRIQTSVNVEIGKILKRHLRGCLFLIEDDANQMIQIIVQAFGRLAEDYLLNKSEAEHIIDAKSN